MEHGSLEVADPPEFLTSTSERNVPASERGQTADETQRSRLKVSGAQTDRCRVRSKRTRGVAGASAERRFEQLRSRWRHRNRRRFLLLTVALLAPCVAGAVLLPGLWRLDAVFIAGVFVGMVAMVWDRPPEHIERNRRGAEGEKRTAKELKALQRAGWSVIHDVECRFGNWDHIAASDAGVFLLDSKNLMGDASVTDGRLTLRRLDAPEEVSTFDRLPRRMRGAAADLSAHLRSKGHRAWVTPVVVVWPELEPVYVEANGVNYVSGPCLVAWLEARPRSGSRHSGIDLERLLPA